MLLRGLEVVLVKTRFSENIGMTARACVNMGCPALHLVAPERWDREKARPLATPKGQGILDRVAMFPDLAQAVAHSTLVVGATARVGGWRQALLPPLRAAREVASTLARGERVSLVFGPEDRGLDNEEITHCHRLVTIPTDPEASSLNLAQAVLLLTYECANAVRARRRDENRASDVVQNGGRAVTAAEQERLMEMFKNMLLRLDALHGDNPDYFLMPWRRLFNRAGLLRHEYDALMGLCRQVRHKLP